MRMKAQYHWLLLTIFSISCQDSTTILAPEGNKLSKFDSLMVSFMSENDIDAGALSIMKNSRVVYEKAFGWKDSEHTQILPQNAMMRMASVSKPITAAAIRSLIAEGKLELTAPVFDLDESDTGVLEIDPFPVLGDTLFRKITVEHLLLHGGGWDREVDKDWVFQESDIASALGVPSPPTQHRGMLLESC
ncbi:MAG TPA: class A beta-lactamase-related serine hydrolase [Gemmatimonadetes bacterium]|nr:class A beta-lactamase-related serine hydrolase [Gemmatimonadota bacterium]